MKLHLLFGVPMVLLAGAAFAQGVQEKLKMKEVEDHLASTLENHVNSDALTGGINSAICVPAESLAKDPCKALPKDQWAHVTATVDWASFNGKMDDTHGYEAVEENCSDVLMGLNWLSNQGSRTEKNAYQKAAREKVKSVRCRFDAGATKAPSIDLKAGVLTVGFNWSTASETGLNSAVGNWLMKKL